MEEIIEIIELNFCKPQKKIKRVFIENPCCEILIDEFKFPISEDIIHTDYPIKR